MHMACHSEQMKAEGWQGEPVAGPDSRGRSKSRQGTSPRRVPWMPYLASPPVLHTLPHVLPTAMQVLQDLGASCTDRWCVSRRRACRSQQILIIPLRARGSTYTGTKCNSYGQSALDATSRHHVCSASPPLPGRMIGTLESQQKSKALHLKYFYSCLCRR